MLTAAQVPFAEAIAPRLADEKRWLGETVAALDGVLSAEAVGGLVDGVARGLAFVLSPTLLELFLRFPDRRFFTPGASAAHRRFIEHLATGGLDRVLCQVPDLARLMAQVVDDWRRRTTAMACRLERDRHLLEDRFGVRFPINGVVSVGETAVILRDARRTHLVYKARQLGMEAAFGDLLRSVNAKGPSHDLLVPLVIDRGEFGWMEYVPKTAAHQSAARTAYLARAGMLLCLVHALGGADMHADNIRVAGEHPVVVDCEVLLRPGWASTAGGGASVLETGWLPTPYELERCGLVASFSVVRSPRWVHIGTDAVRRRALRSPLAGTRTQVVQYFRDNRNEIVDALSQGFKEMHSLISKRDLALEVFAEGEPRVLLRTSYLYQEAIERLLGPAALASVGARARIVDDLVGDVPQLVRDRPSDAERIAAAERSSVEDLEVPRFSTPAARRHLVWRKRPLGAPFTQSPLQRARTRTRDFTRSEMEAQCRVIDESVAAASRGSFGAWRVQLGFPAALEAEEAWPFPEPHHSSAPGSPADANR